MPIPIELVALGAPVLVAVSNLVASSVAVRLGAAGFNLLRLVVAVAGMDVLVLIVGPGRALSAAELGALALSALIGLVLGDTAIYAALARIGARRTGLLYATSGPMSAGLGFAFLGEVVQPARLGGIALVFAGVWLAVANRRSVAVRWEGTQTGSMAGILFGLLGALSQAGGVLLARPVMAAGASPASAVLVRLTVALVAMLILAAVFPRMRPAAQPDLWALSAGSVSGLLGTAAATALVLLALQTGSAGVVGTLASTTPVMLLILLWRLTGDWPALPAWIGALLAVLGTTVLAVT